MGDAVDDTASVIHYGEAAMHWQRVAGPLRSRLLPLLIVVGVAAGIQTLPAGAQGSPALVGTRETVFSAPGLGRAVSTYEDTVVAGGDNAVQVYSRELDAWSHTATLTADDLSPGDNFGASVNLSGDFVLVGAPDAVVAGRARAGAAYVFQRLADRNWVQRAKLVSASPSVGARFGASLDASAQLWFVIGSPGVGQATIFEPVEPGMSWHITAELSGPGLSRDEAVAAGFGVSVAIEVSFGFKWAAVGAPFAAGAGQVYTYLGDGSAWTPWASLIDDPRVVGERFGQALAVEATSLLVGAPGINAISGYLFAVDTPTFTSLGRDIGGRGFGRSVGIGSAHGIAGDPGARTAYLYGRTTVGGNLAGTLLPSAAEPTDGFGASVAVNRAAVVGAPATESIHIFDLGSTSVFDRASIQLTGASSSMVAGDVYGRVTVTRAGNRVIAVTGRGRLVSDATGPPPYVAFELRRLGASNRLVGTITLRDAATGLATTLHVNTSVRALSATEVAGSGIGLDFTRLTSGAVHVRWRVDDLAP